MQSTRHNGSLPTHQTCATIDITAKRRLELWRQILRHSVGLVKAIIELCSGVEAEKL
jgi:hypothetical protein